MTGKELFFASLYKKILEQKSTNKSNYQDVQHNVQLVRAKDNPQLAKKNQR